MVTSLYCAAICFTTAFTLGLQNPLLHGGMTHTTFTERIRYRIFCSSLYVFTPEWSLVPRLITTVFASSGVLPQRLFHCHVLYPPLEWDTHSVGANILVPTAILSPMIKHSNIICSLYHGFRSCA